MTEARPLADRYWFIAGNRAEPIDVPVPEFWQQLMSGEYRDPVVGQLAGADAWLVIANDMTSDMQDSEMHPAGDEFHYLVSGRVGLVLEEDDEDTVIEMSGRHLDDRAEGRVAPVRGARARARSSPRRSVAGPSTAPGADRRRCPTTHVGALRCGAFEGGDPMTGLGRRLIAEFLGTFWLVLGGCGAAVLASGFKPQTNLGIGLVGVSLAFGLTVLTGVYALGAISGGHFNPAVTVGLWLSRRVEAAAVLPYIVVQVLGAIAGAGVLAVIANGAPGFDLKASGFAANGYQAHSPGLYSLAACFTVEIVLTAFFVLVILGATAKTASVGFAGLAIGLALTLIHLISIPVTNTSVNPARSTGPAIFVGDWALKQLWLFWVAPDRGRDHRGRAVLAVGARRRRDGERSALGTGGLTPAHHSRSRWTANRVCVPPSSAPGSRHSFASQSMNHCQRAGSDSICPMSSASPSDMQLLADAATR